MGRKKGNAFNQPKDLLKTLSDKVFEIFLNSPRLKKYKIYKLTVILLELHAHNFHAQIRVKWSSHGKTGQICPLRKLWDCFLWQTLLAKHQKVPG